MLQDYLGELLGGVTNRFIHESLVWADSMVREPGIHFCFINGHRLTLSKKAATE